MSASFVGKVIFEELAVNESTLALLRITLLKKIGLI